MERKDKKLHERISVSLDPKSAKLIKELQNKYDTSKSKVVRKSLRCLDAIMGVGEGAENIPLSTVSIYVDMMLKGEHIILDTAHWRFFFRETDKSEEFWTKVRKVAEDHWEEYHDKGVDTVEDILNYAESTNWYDLRKDSEKTFTLILRVPESRRFVREFFEGLFGESPYKVELKEKYGKIRLRILS